jgi:hypothetical protein
MASPPLSKTPVGSTSKKPPSNSRMSSRLSETHGVAFHLLRMGVAF